MPTLREIFTPLIAYTLFLTGTPDEYKRPFADIRTDFQRLLDQQKAAVNRNDIAPQEYENACFAIIAWVDEALMRCALEGNPELFAEWRRAPLQVELFNTANAGEEFFERLARLSPAQKQVVELYYLALCLGFRGRYYDESQEPQLIELRRQWAAHLPMPLLEPVDFEKRQEHVTPEPYEIAAPAAKPPVSRLSPYWLALPALALAALLLYLLWPAGPNRGAVENAVAGLDCASITPTFDKRHVSLTGHVASEEQREQVRSKVAAIPRIKDVSDNLTVIPRPFCQVMAVLDPLKNPSETAGFDLRISPSKGCDSTYHKGENLVVEITANKPLQYIYVDYYVADREQVAHLLPNLQRVDNALHESRRLMIGTPQDKQQWEIQPPFGREMVTVVSSPKPLLPPRALSETADDYLDSLKKALAADLPGDQLAASYCFTTTEEGSPIHAFH